MYNYQCPSCGFKFTLPQNIMMPKCPSCGQPCKLEQPDMSANNYSSGMYGQQNYGYSPNNREPELFENGPSGKSRGLTGLFAILLGWLGVHYFYINKTSGGILCILLTFISCGLWEFVSFIQGILILTMRQSEFEQKYVHSNSTMPLF